MHKSNEDTISKTGDLLHDIKGPVRRSNTMRVK